MKLNFVTASLFCVTALACSRPAVAQNTSPFTFNIGGGFTEPAYRTGDRLDTGFNINAGVGYNFVPHVGVIGEFGFNNFGLNRTALTAAGVPDGTTRLYSVTLNPIIRFNPRGRLDAYLIGGGGYYRRTIEFTQPAIGNVTLFDPWWGTFFNAPVATNQVIGSFTQNKMGWNAGAGVSFRIKSDSNAKFYAESRYHYVYTTPRRTTVLPVTFGFRW
ncbi:MAG TPA: outer membrane beta-barrel protein [Bryobacteraceae bacterium]|nr:outer membrane beta-barrel protein [Bryobacteraceae bacterium]